MIEIPSKVIDIGKRKGLLMPKKEKIVMFRIDNQWLSIEECKAKGLTIKVKEKNGQYKDIMNNSEALKYIDLPKTVDESYFDNILNEYKDVLNRMKEAECEKVNTNIDKVLTKDDIEKRIKLIEQDLELIYEDKILTKSISTIHKEGQLYAYKSLLRLLSEKIREV